MDKLPIDILRDIIVSELELNDDRVMIWNNKSSVPNDEALFITIEAGSSRALSNSNIQEIRDADLWEVQSMVMQETYIIDILSRGLEALRRKEEVILAMKSTFSEKKQIANAMLIAKIADLRDISSVETTARLFRFSCNVVVQSSYTKEKIVEHYETFPSSVETEDEKVEFVPVITY